jgi:hypothetical protein
MAKLVYPLPPSAIKDTALELTCTASTSSSKSAKSFTVSEYWFEDVCTTVRWNRASDTRTIEYMFTVGQIVEGCGAYVETRTPVPPYMRYPRYQYHGSTCWHRASMTPLQVPNGGGTLQVEHLYGQDKTYMVRLHVPETMSVETALAAYKSASGERK